MKREPGRIDVFTGEISFNLVLGLASDKGLSKVSKIATTRFGTFVTKGTPFSLSPRNLGTQSSC